MGSSLDACICYGFEVDPKTISPDIYESYDLHSRDGLEYLIESFGLDLEISFSGVDFEGTIVHTNRVGRNSKQSFDPSELVPSEDADELLKNFCDLADIPYRKPKWLLIACYG